MNDKEKFPLYLEQLIKKGVDEIEKLSQFEKALTIIQVEEIQSFQLIELEKINDCRITLILKFSNLTENIKIDQFNEMLDEYQKLVQNFAYNFPIE